jgi:nucleoside-diphosphate-sugar epimerase
MPGGAARRCPDISKLTRLGYKPRVLLGEGLKPTLDWYWSNIELAPKEA